MGDAITHKTTNEENFKKTYQTFMDLTKQYFPNIPLLPSIGLFFYLFLFIYLYIYLILFFINYLEIIHKKIKNKK